MVYGVTLAAAIITVSIIGFLWQRTKGRAMLRELRAQQAAGTARAWIDAKFPAATRAARGNAFGLRQRLCALALCGDVATVERETAAIEGDFVWRMIATMGGLLGIAVKGDAASVAPRAKALVAEAEQTLKGNVRTIHVSALRAVSNLIDSLAGAAPPPAQMSSLQKATAYQPYYRALAWEGMVAVCERAGDQRAGWMKDALAKNALEV